MNKIFKGLAMIFIVAILILPVFGADAQFDLTTTVEDITQIKLGAADTSTPDNASAFISFSSVTDSVDVTRNTNETVKKLFVMTNKPGYKIDVTATALKTTIGSTSYYINYSLFIGGESEGTTVNDTNIVVNNVITKSGLTELTIDAYAIGVGINTLEYDSALPGIYTGTITFNVTSTT